VVHGGDSSKPARSLRPFYLIGHGANTLEEAREYLALGANALEVDVNLQAGKSNVLCIGHGPLMGAGPTAKKHCVPLADFLAGLHDLARTNRHFCLVYFDCKTLAATPELGVLLLDNIRTHLTGGDEPVDLLTLISVGKLKEKAMFAQIATNLGPREALMVDGYSDPAAVSHFFTESGVTNQAFSDGIVPLNPLLSHLQVFGAVSKACRLRDQQHHIRFVGTWTVNNPWLMTRFINMGVDGIIVDRRFVWYNFSFANWGRGLSSLTKIVQKRGEILGIRPANRDDNPFDLHGPREQPAIARRHDAKPPDAKPF
jgi:glycerophosphoryl diester phosphodiesterase